MFFSSFFKFYRYWLKNNLHFVHFSKSYFYLINDFWPKKCVIIAKKTMKNRNEKLTMFKFQSTAGRLKNLLGKKVKKNVKKTCGKLLNSFSEFLQVLSEVSFFPLRENANRHHLRCLLLLHLLLHIYFPWWLIIFSEGTFAANGR